MLYVSLRNSHTAWGLGDEGLFQADSRDDTSHVMFVHLAFATMIDDMTLTDPLASRSIEPCTQCFDDDVVTTERTVVNRGVSRIGYIPAPANSKIFVCKSPLLELC